MPRLPTTRRLATFALLLAVFCAGFAHGAVTLLKPISAPQAIPGQALSIDITALDSENPPNVMLERAPVEVTLERTDNAWQLNWAVPTTVRPTTRIVLLAVDREEPSRRQRIELMIDATEAPAATRAPVKESGTQAASAPRAQAVVVEPEDPAENASAPASLTPLAFPELADQQLRVGKPFSLWLRARGAAADESVSIQIESGPDGVLVDEQEQGWHRLYWTPGPDQTGTHRLELLAASDDDPLRQVRDELSLVVAPQGTTDLAKALDTIAAPTEPVQAIAEVKSKATAPSLKIIPNHIVSAGRAVQFRVTPETETDQAAVVQIDRLPRNASFDENPDGSRTFHWLTSDRDQGEHRFQFTVMNAVDAALRDSQEVTIIVGDPTRGKTEPAR